MTGFPFFLLSACSAFAFLAVLVLTIVDRRQP